MTCAPFFLNCEGINHGGRDLEPANVQGLVCTCRCTGAVTVCRLFVPNFIQKLNRTTCLSVDQILMLRTNTKGNCIGDSSPSSFCPCRPSWFLVPWIKIIMLTRMSHYFSIIIIVSPNQCTVVHRMVCLHFPTILDLNSIVTICTVPGLLCKEGYPRL